MRSLRNTTQRNIVLEAILKMDNHPSADQVFEKIKETNPKISRATVYRNLEVLSKLGKILRLKMPSGADCYDYNIEDHQHIRCDDCKNVYDIDIPDVPKIEFEEDVDGFVVREYTIAFGGTCPQCNSGK